MSYSLTIITEYFEINNSLESGNVLNYVAEFSQNYSKFIRRFPQEKGNRDVINSLPTSPTRLKITNVTKTKSL